jgi:Fur family ferric uptake transcriptional regulator
MQEAIDLLRRSRLKLTPRRLALIELFWGASGPLTPAQVQAHLKTRFDQCGLPGIYRNLEMLAECGVLQRVVRFGRKRSYVLGSRLEKEHHHHIICISCGRVGRVEDCRYDEGMIVDGYRLVSHVLQLQGICALCSSTST